MGEGGREIERGRREKREREKDRGGSEWIRRQDRHTRTLITEEQKKGEQRDKDITGQREKQ